MKPEEFQSLTKDIISNLSDQSKVTNILTQLNDTYMSTYNLHQNAEQEREQHKKEIQALKETNMNLFLKIKTPIVENEAPPEDKNEGESLTFEKLVEEMGN